MLEDMTSSATSFDHTAPRGVLVDLGPIAQLRAGRLARRLPQLYVGLFLYGVSSLPETGTITADGVDISRYPAAARRRRVAVTFQDFARFEVSAADNIAFGAPEAMTDRTGILEAAADAAADRALQRLPGGLDVPLARHLAGGTDLSGGQWQRIALSRALFAMRHGRSVLVLDEPTAALDVRAEARFFDEFRQMTQGVTTVLISHRFSTVRHADLIVVLEDGRVVEQGDHQQLLAKGGRYADLFDAQARRFTDDTPSPMAAGPA